MGLEYDLLKLAAYQRVGAYARISSGTEIKLMLYFVENGNLLTKTMESSAPKLAAGAGCGERAVRMALASLECKGWVPDSAAKGSGDITYHLQFLETIEFRTPATIAGVSESTGSSAPATIAGVTECDSTVTPANIAGVNEIAATTPATVAGVQAPLPGMVFNKSRAYEPRAQDDRSIDRSFGLVFNTSPSIDRSSADPAPTREVIRDWLLERLAVACPLRDSDLDEIAATIHTAKNFQQFQQAALCQKNPRGWRVFVTIAKNCESQQANYDRSLKSTTGESEETRLHRERMERRRVQSHG